jgi:large subunit ribosomal protein L31
MKKDIHPDYQVATVKCVCGNEFQTRSTLKEINVEICSACHPFFTGQQKLIDSAGRVDRFLKKYGKEYASNMGEKDAPKPAAVPPKGEAEVTKEKAEPPQEAAPEAKEPEAAPADEQADEPEAADDTK